MNKQNSNDENCDFNDFKRVNYFHGMLMTDRDFREEQIYHNEKRKLINRMLHGWGVVCGLGLDGKPGSSIITIEQGMALDCSGNEIVVCEPYKIDLTSKTCLCTKNEKPVKDVDCQELERARDQPNIYYIGIRYNEDNTDPVPVYAPGGDCEEKLCKSSRIREGFCVKIFDHPPVQPQIRPIHPSLIKRIYDGCKGDVVVHEGSPQKPLDDPEKIMLAAGASNVNGFYNNMQIRLDVRGNTQIRTIKSYSGTAQTATVDSPWDPDYLPDPESTYSITESKNECMRKTVEEFTKDFCSWSPPCPDCCPDEHYLVLGKVEIDPIKKTIKNIISEDRYYLLTVHLFQYIFSSLLKGADTLFEVTGMDEQIPDINLIHRNPIAALCWLGKIFVNDANIEPKEEGVERMIAGRKLYKRVDVDSELAKLRKEVDELKGALQKPSKKQKGG